MGSSNLLNKVGEVPKDRRLVVFDLDGTLTESKADMDKEMASLLSRLLQIKKVAVIGGGKYELFQKQLLFKLNISAELLKNLFLFPMTATAFYKYDNNEWIEVYRQRFSKKEKEEIMSAFEKTFQELNYRHPDKIYGELVEDRGAEITFSIFGQEALLELKKRWNKENPNVRTKMEKVLQKHLPDMEVKIAGLTSIDVARKGVDKAYGIRQMEKYLDISPGDVLFVGDAFSYESNDNAALKTGVLCFEVKSIEDTKNLVRYLLSK